MDDFCNGALLLSYSAPTPSLCVKLIFILIGPTEFPLYQDTHEFFFYFI